jgi:hypothetical protein
MGRRLVFTATREVDNPSLTNGLLYSEQKNAHLRVTVEENAMTRIGALCFIRRRTKDQEQAAERFKSAYEAMFGSGVPALDNSRPVVDRSPIAHDSGMAAKIDRGYDIRRLLWGMPATEHREGLQPYLTQQETDRLVAALVLCIPAGEGLSWRPRQRAVDELLSALDSLSVYWGLKSRAA